jgi:hypothetical protein
MIREIYKIHSSKESKLPDIALGALIAVIGGVVGYIISYKTSQQQIKARRDELNQQLSYQEKEAQRNRLIEARKELLLELRKTASEWIGASHHQINMIVRLKKALNEYDESSPSRQLEIREYIEITERLKQLSSQFDNLRRQLSDSSLNRLLEAVRDEQYEIDTARQPLIRFFNNPGDADISELESAMKRDEALRQKVADRARLANKRIEELLSGEPPD